MTRFGARNTLVPGLVLIALALVLFAQVPVQGSYFVHVMPSMLLLGIGAGICFPALMNVAMSGIGPQDAGLASGLVNTTAQVGGALGLAVLATLSSLAQPAPAGAGPLERRRAHRRLSPRVLDRRRAHRRRARDRARRGR